MDITKIQWCHSTINPVMGCSGCELFPGPEQLCRLVDRALKELGVVVDSRAWFIKTIARYYRKIRVKQLGHANELSTTNIWHLREIFSKAVALKHGKEAGKVALDTIRSRMTCYAAILHLARGSSIVNPTRKVNRGYAPTFERFTVFEGRMEQASRWRDLVATRDATRPWLDRLPRLIFLSDMGDALCSRELFAFLEREMAHVTSEHGRRHLWLWLTKRPGNMEAFDDRIGGLPDNVCAMTTVTSRKSLPRIDQLRKVNAACRGISIEPLWERIPPEELDLTGIDWVIVGGESGSGKLTRPFDIAWAEELRDHCRKNGVAFFLKQLGRNPVIGGQPVKLKDKHGGDWNEWPSKLRVRQFPAYFRDYRRGASCVL